MLTQMILKEKRRFLRYWLSAADELSIELRQAHDEGLEITDEHICQAQSIMNARDSQSDQRAISLYQTLAKLPIHNSYPYKEPDSLEDIIRDSDIPEQRFPLPNLDMLEEHVLGALIGRCAGCLLGQPVEGFMRERLLGFLRTTNNYPIHRYMSSDVSEEIRKEFALRDEAFVYGGLKVNWINNVTHMPEDDDTNYTILALKIMEDYGLDFTSLDVADSWMMELPIGHTCTGERIAYRNLTMCVWPPDSARANNPFRETVGGQIRADGWGYAAYGDPSLAARMAYTDACVTHTKNGVYGEMWVAVMLAAAHYVRDMEALVELGVHATPKHSRLRECLDEVLTAYRKDEGAEKCLERIHHRFDEHLPYHWFNILPNAMIVAYALLYGREDFTHTISLAVQAGFDTDCNGATVGSILGLRLGASCIPTKWSEPLHDSVFTSVAGYGLMNIHALARRFVLLIPQRRA